MIINTQNTTLTEWSCTIQSTEKRLKSNWKLTEFYGFAKISPYVFQFSILSPFQTFQLIFNSLDGTALWCDCSIPRTIHSIEKLDMVSLIDVFQVLNHPWTDIIKSTCAFKTRFCIKEFSAYCVGQIMVGWVTFRNHR